MKSQSRRSGGYELVLAADGQTMRIRHLAKTMTALLLGSSGLFGLIGVILLMNPTRSGTVDLGGIFCVACAVAFVVVWVWGHFFPAAVSIRDNCLISRGKVGRKHHASAEQIEGIGVRLRPVFNGRYWYDFYCPYVKLRTGRGFWLYALTGPGAQTDCPAPAQEEAVHRLRQLLHVASLYESERRAAGRRRRTRSRP